MEDKTLKLVFATHNANKLKEIQAIFPKNIQLVSLDEIGCKTEIPETADTIEGNAALKAKYVKEHFGYACFADDTALEVDALSGAPGVYSARYAGKEKNDTANVQKLLKELEDKTSRKAKFKTVIALIFKEEILYFTGICEGEITHAKHGNQGFGYDPVFRPKGFSKTFAEMDLEAKTALSHRGKAVSKLLDYLTETPF